jgi:hypothetical protein
LHVLTSLESALAKDIPPTPAESTLPRPHGSISKQTALNHLECALTDMYASYTKQMVSRRTESTVIQIINLTHSESALAKKEGEGALRYLIASLLRYFVE